VPLEPAPPDGEVVPLTVLGVDDGEGELGGAEALGGDGVLGGGDGVLAGDGALAVGEPVAADVVVGAASTRGASVATCVAVACGGVEAIAPAGEVRAAVVVLAREPVGVAVVLAREPLDEAGLPIGGTLPSCRSPVAGLSASAGDQAVVLVRLPASRPRRNAAPNTTIAKTASTGAKRRSPLRPLHG
jgi:hypothetical protein